ncbi:MAG: carbohydrate ABC transporter permease [Armatimonadetes bacterium]|nr:carbohydrate ABC transporter permease [Armatimonadota bacterium]MDE2207932.1 carbohydrate ABC transporter permease [Armatimonadota bacterium]
MLVLGGGRWLVQNAAVAGWCTGAVASVVALVWVGQLLLARAPALVRSVVLNTLLLGALAAFLLPIYWITVTSLKPPVLIDSLTPRFIFHPTLVNYGSLLFHHLNDDPSARITGLSAFPVKLFNSLLIGLAATALALLLGTTAAYSLARFRIKGKSDALFFILSTRMLPPIVVVIPIFLMYRFLGLLDTRLGLVILYTMTNVSFAAYLMKGFFDDIPHEYDDAALLDGCSRLQAFRRVSLPQATTGMAATAVFCFITAWNEFAFAQLLATGEPLTAPPYIVSRTGSGGIDWGPIAAGALIFLIPAALFTFLMRRHLLRGVTFGAIKR